MQESGDLLARQRSRLLVGVLSISGRCRGRTCWALKPHLFSKEAANRSHIFLCSSHYRCVWLTFTGSVRVATTPRKSQESNPLPFDRPLFSRQLPTVGVTSMWRDDGRQPCRVNEPAVLLMGAAHGPPWDGRASNSAGANTAPRAFALRGHLSSRAPEPIGG
jgi:hypothetical protein